MEQIRDGFIINCPNEEAHCMDRYRNHAPVLQTDAPDGDRWVEIGVSVLVPTDQQTARLAQRG